MCKEISCCFFLWSIKKIKLIAARMNLICNCNNCNLKRNTDACNNHIEDLQNKQESKKVPSINDLAIRDI